MLNLDSRGIKDLSRLSHADGEDRRALETQLVALSLRDNRIASLDGGGFLALAHLSKLVLSGNSLEDLAGGLPPGLRHLDVSRNALVSVRGLEPLLGLEYLDVSFNRLTSLAGLPALDAAADAADRHGRQAKPPSLVLRARGNLLASVKPVVESVSTALHARIPLGLIIRGQWLNLCFDLRDLVAQLWPGAEFASVELVSVAASCKVRRIATLRGALADTTEDDVQWHCDRSLWQSTPVEVRRYWT